MRTGINLFTLRDVGEPLPQVLERVGETDFHGVEFIHRLPEADVDAVTDALEETGLDVPGAHLGPFDELDDLGAELDRTADLYERVGVEALAVSVSEERLETTGDVEETAAKLDRLAERAAGRGFDFCYHNHYWEFSRLDGTPRLRRLLDETGDGVGVELDVGWAAAGGVDPVEWIESLGDRLRILHVKDADVAEKASVEVGEGDVDLDACIEAAADVGVEWFVYEHDEPDDPLASLARGAEFLSRHR